MTQRRHNRSAFNGGEWTASDYSTVRCPECGCTWRTKAAYVAGLPDARSDSDRAAAPEDALRAAAEVIAAAAPEIAAEELIAATNFFGPLSPPVRRRVLTLVGGPSVDTWDDAFSIILNANPGTGLGVTLWQAVLEVDPDCPRSGAPYAPGEVQTPAQRWDGYFPDPMTVLTAIRVAVGLQTTRPRQEPPR